MALSEACSNVIEHSDVDDQYEVRMEVHDRVCAIRVMDAGHGFDAESLSQTFPGAEAMSGRGLALMHALTDRIDFDSKPERGCIVHLTKALVLDGSGALSALLLRNGA